MDTMFVHGGLYCGKTDGQVVVNELAPKHDFWVLPVKEIEITNADRVVGGFLGDESDHNLENTVKVLRKHEDYVARYPQVGG